MSSSRITFRVVDTRDGKDITNDYWWVLMPDGSLKYNEYGDLIGLTYAKAIISVKED